MRDHGIMGPSGVWTPRRYVRGEGQPATLVYGRHRIRNADGSIAEVSDWRPNALANEGESDCLNTWLLGAPASFKYLCLLTAKPTIATTMESMSELFEPPLNGYSRQKLETSDWQVPTLDGSYAQTVAAEKTFGPATEAWTGITHAALVTTASGTSGKFLLAVALSGTVSLKVGQSFEYVLHVQMQ